MHALVASPFKSAYNAAKHGVAGFTKTAALEVSGVGRHLHVRAAPRWLPQQVAHAKQRLGPCAPRCLASQQP